MKKFLLALVVSMGLLLSCTTSAPTSTPEIKVEPISTPTVVVSPTAVPTIVRNEPSQILVGALSFNPKGVEEFEQSTGHKTSLALHFYNMCSVQSYDWDGFISQLKSDKAAGHTVILTLEPWCPNWNDPEFQKHPERAQPEFDLAKITTEKFDTFFAQIFQTINYTGANVIFRFAQEMNTPTGQTWWYPWQGEPQGYTNAYRRIWQVARQVHTKAKFMWSPMWLDHDADAYYPGDEFVDMIGTTILNQGNTYPSYQSHWQTPAELLAVPLKVAADKWPNKPLFLVEVASSEYGGDKAEWIRELGAYLSANPVAGIVFLETVDLKPTEIKDRDGKFIYIDWRAQSSEKALAAMREILQLPIFK